MNAKSHQRRVAILTGASGGLGKKYSVIISNPITVASPAEDCINWKPTEDQDRD